MNSIDINKNYVINQINEELISEAGADAENILNIFLNILKILKKEEGEHIMKALYEENDLRSAFICNEALAAYESLTLILNK